MRTMPPKITTEILVPEFERLKKKILCSILCMPEHELSEQVFSSCNFSIKEGGLGLHDTKEVAYAGYVSSIVYYSISNTGVDEKASEDISNELRRLEWDRNFHQLLDAVNAAKQKSLKSAAALEALLERHGPDPAEPMNQGLLAYAQQEAAVDRDHFDALVAASEHMRLQRSGATYPVRHMFYDFVQLLADPDFDVAPDIPLLRDKVAWILQQRNARNRDEGTVQSWLTEKMSKRRHKDLQDSMDEIRLAWFVELQCQEAGLWLIDKPKFASMRFSNAEFRTALRYRLMLPVYNLRAVGYCTCRQNGRRAKIDRYGLHLGTGCGLERLRKDTHDDCVLCIDNMLRWMGHSTAREEKGLFREAGNNDMRPDISINNPVDTTMRKLLLDFSVAAPVKGGGYGEPVAESRAVALKRFHLGFVRCAEKTRLYGGLASQIGCGFLPVVYMSTGAPSPATKEFFFKTAKNAAGYLKLSTKTIYDFVLRQVSVKLQQGLARSINQRVYGLNSGASGLAAVARLARGIE